MNLNYKFMKTKYFQRINSLVFIALVVIFIGCNNDDSKEHKGKTIINQVDSNTTVTYAAIIEKEAVSKLSNALSYLGNLDQFTVQTQGTYEDLLDGIHRVDYETSSRLTVKRPDNIHIERYGLKMHQIFYFDGKDFTLNNSYDKVYATEPVSGDIEDMLAVARDSLGISGPASDLVYRNSFSLLSQDIKSAKVIGKEMIGDMMCDHLFFDRSDGVSFQIWISDSAPYLPYKYVVTDTSTPNLLSFGIVMSNWDTDPKISDKLFQFTPTKDLKKIMFLKIDPNKE